MANIIVFGTSTTYGAWDTEGGWVQRLRAFIDQKIIESEYKLDFNVYNLGISGDTSVDILGRFDSEAKVRLDIYYKDNIFLFHFGINDCVYDNEQERLIVGEELFRQNIVKLIEQAKYYTQKIVFVGSMPVDKRVDPIPWAPTWSYKNEYVDRYEQILKEVSKENNVHFIPVFEKFINTQYSDLLADGVHMNDEGYKRLYELVKEYLLENKIITFDKISPNS